MRMSKTEGERGRRINMRVSERQERMLRAAAELNGETLTVAPASASCAISAGVAQLACTI